MKKERIRKVKFLDYDKGIKFQATGKTIEQAFAHCALAITRTLTSDEVKKKRAYSIKSQGSSQEQLLYNFLEEILFLFRTENFLISKVKEIKIKENKLKAKVLGDNIENYEIKNNIKSPTKKIVIEKDNEQDIWVITSLLNI